MSYKINPNATTTDPGNLSGADKTKLDALPTFDAANNAYNLATPQTTTLYVPITDNLIMNSLPAVATGWTLSGNSWINTVGTTTANPSVCTVNLNRFVGATLASIKVYYLVTHAAPTGTGLTYSVGLRGKSNNATSTVLAATTVSYASQNVFTSVTTSISATTIAADGIFYVIFNNETGTGAASGQSIYGFEFSITNINKIYLTNSK